MDWENLDTHLRKHNLQIFNIAGDGYCFLNSVLKCLYNDYGDTLTLEDCITKIVSHLCIHHRQYTAFHHSESQIYASDKLVADALDFFRTGRFNTDIVDLLMQITCDALNLHLFIYQRHETLVQVLNFASRHPDPGHCIDLKQRVVRVKYIHNNLHSGGNHYDAVIRTQAASPMKHPAAPQPPAYSESKPVKPEAGECIDLTESDDEYSFPHSDSTYLSTDQTDTEPLSSPGMTPISTPSPVFNKPARISTSTTSTSEDEFYPPKYFVEHDPETLLQNISRGKPFPTWYFENKEPEYVPNIPLDIDGTAYYQIRTTQKKWNHVTADLRHFTMTTSSREGFQGYRRIGTCEGSFVCRNECCPFVATSRNHVPNRASWRSLKGHRNMRICAICDRTGFREGCGAKKLVEFNEVSGIATVYHLGSHKCGLKIDMTQRNSIIKNRIQERNLSGKAKEVSLQEIGKFIQAGSMDLAASEAGAWVDRRAVKRQMEILTPQSGADHNSFDAVGILKATTDKKDPYYIYNIGNKNYSQFGNMAGTDHVFKSSRKMAQLALQMDVDAEENILQLENAYFDATHTRVYGFKTFALWLLHPAMKQMIWLASMEIRSENHIHIAVFFRLFNQMLAEIKGEEGFMFKPRYFICDEGGANYKAVREVYGDDFCKNRVKGCQWHFKSDKTKHANKVGVNRRPRFEAICNEMCTVTTVAGFNGLMVELKTIAEEYPELKPFVEYWDRRKSHVFGPYRGGGIPGMNLSEPGNVTMKPPGTLRLVKAAIYDVSHMMLQESQMDQFERNLIRVSGRGQTKEVRDARDRAEQIRAAEEFANIFMDDSEAVILEAEQGINPESYLPKKNAKHRAPKARQQPVKKATAKPRKRAAAKGTTGVTEQRLREQCILAMDVTDEEITPDGRSNKVDNPPQIIMATQMIRKCKGCKGNITQEDKEYPHNMVFRRRGVVGYYNAVRNQWVDNEQNVHFHLDMRCIRKSDDTMEIRYISGNDETFAKLDRLQMEVLHANGFLKPLARKKCLD